MAAPPQEQLRTSSSPETELIQETNRQEIRHTSVETTFPEKLNIGEEYQMQILYSSPVEITSVKVTLNGDDLLITSDNEISFSLVEDRRNVLNLKFFDSEGGYDEKVYYMEGVPVIDTAIGTNKESSLDSAKGSEKQTDKGIPSNVVKQTDMGIPLNEEKQTDTGIPSHVDN